MSAGENVETQLDSENSGRPDSRARVVGRYVNLPFLAEVSAEGLVVPKNGNDFIGKSCP